MVLYLSDKKTLINLSSTKTYIKSCRKNSRNQLILIDTGSTYNQSIDRNKQSIDRNALYFMTTPHGCCITTTHKPSAFLLFLSFEAPQRKISYYMYLIDFQHLRKDVEIESVRTQADQNEKTLKGTKPSTWNCLRLRTEVNRRT